MHAISRLGVIAMTPMVLRRETLTALSTHLSSSVDANIDDLVEILLAALKVPKNRNFNPLHLFSVLRCAQLKTSLNQRKHRFLDAFFEFKLPLSPYSSNSFR